MSRYISVVLRKLVTERANYICEYCLAYEGFSFVKFQIEHIISLKHGGLTHEDNLALSCFTCNNNKGTDIGSIIEKGDFIRFYNPRKDIWQAHFELKGNYILPKTDIAFVTAKILGFNELERLEERQAFMDAGHFPHSNALYLLK